jgi:hypothetical protein
VNLRKIIPIGTVVVLLAASLVSAQTTKSKSAKAPSKAPAAASRTKVAEGRYEVVGGKAGAPSFYREPWTLFKTPVGYELEEQWTVTSPNAAESTVDVAVSFAAGLYPLQVRIGGQNSPQQMFCEMALKEFKCTTQSKESKLAMHGAYNVFLPSPWMLGSIARRARKIPNQSAAVQLVMMGGMEAQGPKLVSFPADVQYVGDDEVSIGGEKIAASIFELKSPNTGIPGVTIPGTLIWTSSEGVVLALQDSNKPEQRIELVEYKRYGKF